MTDAEKAYAEAERLIADVRVSGRKNLNLIDGVFRHLTKLPPEISSLSHLEGISIERTNVSDISPLTSLKSLEVLILFRTSVSDLTPLSELTSLQTLWVNQTPVVDLRPVRKLFGLVEKPSRDGIRFANCAAANVDPIVQAISEVEDTKQRAQLLFDHIDALPPWPEPLPSPPYPPSDDGLPAPRPAPTQTDIVGQRLVKIGGEGLPEADIQQRAERGWDALRKFRNTFGAAFNIHNHPELNAFLTAFDAAMGDEFDPDSSILIATMSSGITALADDSEYCKELPVGAAPLLAQFASELDTYLNRFPDVVAYRADAEDTESDVAAQSDAFVSLGDDLRDNENVDQDVSTSYDIQVEGSLADGSAEGTRRGLVASTREVVRAVGEQALDEVKVAGENGVRNMDDLHDKELAKLAWYAGGWAVVLMRRRQANLRRLAKAYPRSMGWLDRVLDRVVGSDGSK